MSLDDHPLLLAPMPRRLERREGQFRPAAPRRLEIGLGESSGRAQLAQEFNAALDRLAPGPPALGFADAGAGSIVLRIDPMAAPEPQGYRLEIDPEAGIQIAAHGELGAWYAAMTLRQLARCFAGLGALPALVIEDAPDFTRRGAMLDISRCKVPTLDSLRALIDRLAEYKINEFQLYMEHSFAYARHPEVWRDASPLSAEDVRALDDYCRARHIELVPNQNSFGHFHRWTEHPRYAPLAEGEGCLDLCPTDPACLGLLEELYAELLPNFTSGQFNVGCDETAGIGRGRSRAAVERQGAGRVYLDFLRAIHQRVREHGRRMQFWGDIIVQHPELVPELPGGVLALEWGYEADHPFAEHGGLFAESGVPFYVVPGTSSWCSLAGRTDNMLENLRIASAEGLRHGAEGLMVADWGDAGHWQYPAFAEPGWLHGAALAWCAETNRSLDLADALDLHAWGDRTGRLGQMALDLGRVAEASGLRLFNGNFFYLALRFGVETDFNDRSARRPWPEGLTLEGLEASEDARLEALAGLDRVDPADALLPREFAQTVALMGLAIALTRTRLEHGGRPSSALPTEARRTLAEALEPLLPEYRRLWTARNRSGGLAESIAPLEDLFRILSAD